MPPQRAPSSQRQGDSLASINSRLAALEKRIGIIEDRFSSGKVSGKERNPTHKSIGWILIAIGLFVGIFGNSIVRSLFRTSYLGFILSPFGWLAVLAGIIVLIVYASTGSSTAQPREENADFGKEEEEKEEILLQAPTKRTAITKPEKKVQQKTEKSNVEANIGMKWFARIGIISLVLSVAFFIIYAIQNKLIGPAGQIALGILIGIILIVLGELFDKKERYAGYARTLTGGGFAILYFAIYAAYSIYHLIVYDWLAVIILSIIILFGVIFSIRYNSQVIAGEAFLLGYIVPIVIGNITFFSLIYSVLLSTGLAFVSFSRGWISLSFGGIFLSYIIHGIWLGNNYNDQSTQYIHCIFLLMYIVLFTVLALFVKGKESVSKEKSNIPETFIYLVFGLSYLFMFFIRLKSEMLLVLIALIVGIMFLMFKQRMNYLILVSIVGSYMTQIIWLSGNYTETSMPTHMVFVTIYFMLFTIASFLSKDRVGNVIAALLNSFMYLGLMLVPIREFYPNMDGLFSLGLAVFYLIGAYVAYTTERKYIFNTFAFLCLSYLSLAIPLQFNQAWVTIFWAIEALLLLLLSFRLKEEILRILSTIIAGLASFKLLIYDSWALQRFSLDNAADSTRFFSFIGVIIIIYVMSAIYSKNKKLFDNYGSYIKYVATGLAIAATALTTLIFTIEIASSSGLGELKQMWISIAWIIQGLVILVYGFSKQKRTARIIGIVLFGISIFKIFLFDLSMLATLYRIVSFFVLGIILLFAAFIYYKYKEYI